MAPTFLLGMAAAKTCDNIKYDVDWRERVAGTYNTRIDEGSVGDYKWVRRKD